MVDLSIGVRYATAVMCLAAALTACTGGVHGSGSSGTPSAPQYTVGGTVSGLTGSGLVLASNTGETLNVSGNGSFTFTTTFPAGSPYYVLVLQQPGTPTQTCLATNSSGTIENSSVSGITVTCQDKTATTDTIGGVVVGLTGSGLVLQNGSDTITVAANGNFVFPTAVASGTQYNISVLSPPINPYEDCAVLNGQGITGGADIANIGIVCTVNSSPTYTIGGTVTGVSGTLVLEDNGRDDLTITANGPFTFPLAIPSGSSYDVTTKSAAGTQSQACTFVNATGMVGDSNITNVTITCTANVGLTATVAGLAGTGLVLQNTSNGDSVAVTANGNVSFPSGISPGEAYNVTITGQPANPTQTCVVGNGAGTAPETTVVTVTCTTNTYTVGGVVTGLPDPQSVASTTAYALILQDNTGDTFTIPAASTSPVSFSFPTPIASGSTYTVSVQQQPGIDTSYGAGVQTSTVCVVAGGTGTVTNANIANVAVTCIRPLGFAYVTNTTDNTISTYVIDSATGALLPSGAPVSTGTAPSGATLGNDPNGNNVLYTSNSGSNNVSGFQINPNAGNLTPIAGSPFTLGGLSAPSSIAASGEAFYGTGLYATNPGPAAGTGSISAATIGATDGLTDVAGTPFATGSGATGAQWFNGASILNQYAFLLETNTSSNTVSSFLLNQSTGVPQVPGTGATAPAGNAPTSVAGLAIYIAANEDYSSFAYVANSGDGTLSSYSVDTNTGGLAALTIAGPAGPIPVPPTPIESGLSAVTIAGQTSSCPCYVFASAPHGVWGFSVSAGGLLTALPNSPFAAGTGPGAITTLNSQYVYVVNTTDQTISAYVIVGTAAALTPITGTVMKTGRGPSSIVVILRPAFGTG